MSGKRIGVVVDSTSTIPADLVERHNIHVIPQHLNWAGETLRDGVDITPDQFYARLKNSQELPTTSQPSTGEFYEYFSALSADYDAMVGVFISNELSGTCSCASAAAEMMSDYPIEVINSQSASMGLGFVALEVAKAVQKGASHEQVVAVANQMVSKVKTIFAVDTLEYLHRGGRIGGAKRLFGTMLSIKPVLHLEGGRIEPLASVRTKRKAMQKVLTHAEADLAGCPHVHAAVLHAAAIAEARAFMTQVEQRLRPKELLLTDLSPVVGTHTGPGLVGLAYFCED